MGVEAWTVPYLVRVGTVQVVVAELRYETGLSGFKQQQFRSENDKRSSGCSSYRMAIILVCNNYHHGQ